MIETPVTFLSQRQQVVGLLHRPGGRGPFPVVVFLHGFTATSTESRRLFVELARKLASRGVASLRFDFRGSGNSAGTFSEVCIQSEIADAGAALRWVRRQPWADRARIALLGMSMGGLVATQVLARDRRIKAAVLWNPVIFAKGLRDAWMTPDLHRQMKRDGVADWFGWPVGRRLYEDMGSVDPLRHVAPIACPVLLIQSTEDQTTPLAGGLAFESAMKAAGRDVKVHLIPGADHTFARFDWTADVLCNSESWLLAQLA